MLVTNATLVQVSSSGGTDTYDQDPVIAAKWEGEEDAFLDSNTVRMLVPGGSEYVHAWKVYLQRGKPPVTVVVSDMLTVTQQMPDLSTATYTLPVMGVNDRVQPDMPAEVQSVLLLVEPSARVT